MPKRLLLADDSLTIHRVVELTFADEDFEVISVSNGNQAIEKINSAIPDIVIADVNMPEKDGYEVCAFVKNTPQFSSIPVLLLKGTFEPFNQERADSVRADGIIQKPFQSQTLIDKVNNILGLTSSSRPPMPAKTAERIQAEKITQPQPPFSPKPAPPVAPLKDFMPFSHPQAHPQQAPIPKPAPVPIREEHPGHTPISRPPIGVAPLGAPDAMPLKENIRPHTPPPSPHHPVPPKIPPFPAQPSPIGGGQVNAQSQIPPVPTAAPRPPQTPRPIVTAAPETDDSPFGIAAVHPPQPKAVVPKSSENELSKDAFEAGKEIYQTFAEPSEDSFKNNLEHGQIVDESLNESPAVYQGDHIVEAQTETPTSPPAPQIPSKAVKKLPDFSDALSDVSMAFNNMQRVDAKPEGYSPFEDSQPINVKPTLQEAPEGQWDSDLQSETVKAGEIVFSPESFEKQEEVESTPSPYEIEMPMVQDNQPMIAPEPEAIKSVEEFDQLNISSLSEENIQVSMDKPSIPSIPVKNDEIPKPTLDISQSEKAESVEDVASPTDIDALADKVAAKIIEKISAEAIKEIAWELVPGIVEKALRDKLNKS